MLEHDKQAEFVRYQVIYSNDEEETFDDERGPTTSPSQRDHSTPTRTIPSSGSPVPSPSPLVSTFSKNLFPAPVNNARPVVPTPLRSSTLFTPHNMKFNTNLAEALDSQTAPTASAMSIPVEFATPFKIQLPLVGTLVASISSPSWEETPISLQSIFDPQRVVAEDIGIPLGESAECVANNFPTITSAVTEDDTVAEAGSARTEEQDEAFKKIQELETQLVTAQLRVSSQVNLVLKKKFEQKVRDIMDNIARLSTDAGLL